MTLRHRLLLVNGIVVLLSVATVGVAMSELSHARQVFGALQHWNGIVLSAQKLRSAFPPPEPPSPAADEFFRSLLRHYPSLAMAGEYLNVDRPRESLNQLNRAYQTWQESPTPEHSQRTRRALDAYAQLVESELTDLKHETDQQDVRKNILLFVVAGLTILHVAIIGSLLRRWLLLPMEQLNRQVEALGRDEPAPEPLLTSPQEMARLAHALEHARTSLGGLRQQLLQSERLTTIGQLAAQLAHNLRNPLASIRAAAQVSARHAEPVMRSRLEEVIASVDRMNQWIAGLMEVARGDPTATRHLDVVPTLQRVCEAIRSDLAVKELALDLQVPGDGLLCAHDPVTLEHALYAMLVNAVEASPLGSRIQLSGEYVPRESARVCRISVRDQGPGLPADAGRVFEFSYSTKQRGMGLGLALARLALERQGGSAHAANLPEGGAWVYVDLPVASEVGCPEPVAAVPNG